VNKEAWEAASAELASTGALSANTVATLTNAAGQKVAKTGF
jgi:hypothetical protein